jgi:hypothetical protein
MTASPVAPNTPPLTVIGDATGLAIPADPASLVALGPDFLTRAFRTYGLLGEGNHVTRIARAEPFNGGNSGDKLLLWVEYAQADAELPPKLPGELFVKFSRCLGDPFRDRRRAELAAEVRLAALSRHPAFPVAVPLACFADYHEESGTGLLISARVAYGEGGIEPLRLKYHDHLLPDAPAHYRAIVSALARLAAAQQSGRLEPDASALFPFDAEAAAADLPIADGLARLPGQIAALRDFAAACPGLIPPALAHPDFLARIAREGTLFLTHEAELRRFLHADPHLVALAHWNGHLDNAWFWRDDASEQNGGELHCGLIDWGMVRQMNLGYALWGALSGAEPEMLAGELDAFLARFAAELAAQGGAAIPPAKLAIHFDIALMLLGFALMMDAPTLVLSRLPRAVEASSLRDAIMFENEVARSFLHVFLNFLSVWHHRDFGASLAHALGTT